MYAAAYLRDNTWVMLNLLRRRRLALRTHLLSFPFLPPPTFYSVADVLEGDPQGISGPYGQPPQDDYYGEAGPGAGRGSVGQHGGPQQDPRSWPAGPPNGHHGGVPQPGQDPRAGAAAGGGGGYPRYNQGEGAPPSGGGGYGVGGGGGYDANGARGGGQEDTPARLFKGKWGSSSSSSSSSREEGRSSKISPLSKAVRVRVCRTKVNRRSLSSRNRGSRGRGMGSSVAEANGRKIRHALTAACSGSVLCVDDVFEAGRAVHSAQWLGRT